jgi:hypothetical protein
MLAQGEAAVPAPLVSLPVVDDTNTAPGTEKMQGSLVWLGTSLSLRQSPSGAVAVTHVWKPLLQLTPQLSGEPWQTACPWVDGGGTHALPHLPQLFKSLGAKHAMAPPVAGHC